MNDSFWKTLRELRLLNADATLSKSQAIQMKKAFEMQEEPEEWRKFLHDMIQRRREKNVRASLVNIIHEIN